MAAERFFSSMLGWSMFGPVGGILGYVVGSVFENENSARNNFFKNLLWLTAAVIKADNRILKVEVDYVKSFIKKQFGKDTLDDAIPLLKEILKQPIKIQPSCSQMIEIMDYPNRISLLHYLFGIGFSGGYVNEEELAVIEKIAKALEINDNDFISLKNTYYSDKKWAYRVLNIEESATETEIKKAYRAMVIQYHPDKAGHLTEKEQAIANEKIKEINKAFEEIKKYRHFN